MVFTAGEDFQNDQTLLSTRTLDCNSDRSRGLGLPYDYIEVSWETNANMDELAKLIPLKMVPTLLTEQGNVLTQTIAIFEYLADLNPSSGMLAPHGTWERTETMSWTAFAGSDLQKAISLVFQADQITEDEHLRKIIKAHARKKIVQFLAHIDASLKNIGASTNG